MRLYGTKKYLSSEKYTNKYKKIVSFLILLLTNVQGCAIMKLSDREVPYQALLFKKMIGWNLMNGGGRYGIIPVL